MLKYRTPEDILANNTKSCNGCLVWQSSKTKRGYGKVDMISVAKEWKANYAHQLAYKAYYGFYNKELQINHKCHNPSCCNPLHLYLGTHEENMKDMKLIGSNKGTNHSRAKLSDAEVIEIRYLCNTNIRQAEISRMYEVSPMTVSNIKLRKNWIHI